jgi:uncharacterized protein GlcG (DUF336 family)
MNRLVGFTALSLVTASVAWAQTPAAPAPAAPPAQLAPEQTLSLALSLEAAQAALASCKASTFPSNVYVMNTNLLPIVVLADDGARGSAEGARRKAYTVIKKGMTSGAFGKQIGPRPAGSPPVEGDANLNTFAGGIPVKRGDVIVAALAVSGPGGEAADEVCAIAGLDKIKDRVK